MNIRVACHHIWNPEVVKHFKEESAIRRQNPKTLFNRQNIKCHVECKSYVNWQKKHPLEFEELVTNCKKGCSVYVAHNEKVLEVHGKTFFVSGGIKSCDPECIGWAYSNGDHPYTCKLSPTA